MSADENTHPLDFHTYTVLREIIREQRQAYIAEREKESTPLDRKFVLLELQMAMTDIGAQMLERMFPTTNEAGEKKDS